MLRNLREEPWGVEKVDSEGDLLIGGERSVLTGDVKKNSVLERTRGECTIAAVKKSLTLDDGSLLFAEEFDGWRARTRSAPVKSGSAGARINHSLR